MRRVASGSITSVAAMACAAVVGMAGLTACGGGDDAPAADSSPAEVVGGGDLAPLTWPLTGLDADQSTALTHPVYIAKIDNTSSSDPQIGLGEADMVVEELVEGGITRLAAFYYSELPTKVGPIRSMRLTDVDIASPVGARLVSSGAASQTISGLNSAGVKFYNMSNNNAVVRDDDGTHDYLHSVMADLDLLAEEGQIAEARPDDYFDFGTEDEWEGPLKAGTVDVQMSGSRTSQWKFENGRYHLLNGYMGDGDEFVADTLITASVKVTEAPYVDPAGNPVPVSHFEGRGTAVLFHGGQAVRATWHKDGVDDQVTFTTKSGEVLVPAGHTWLHLVPTTGATTFN